MYAVIGTFFLMLSFDRGLQFFVGVGGLGGNLDAHNTTSLEFLQKHLIVGERHKYLHRRHLLADQKSFPDSSQQFFSCSVVGNLRSRL